MRLLLRLNYYLIFSLLAFAEFFIWLFWRGLNLTTNLISARQPICVKGVTLHRVRVPLTEPFRISNGVVTEKDAILVEVKTDDGVVGWGEASPMSGSFYSNDTPESAWTALRRDLIPSLLSAGAVDATRFYERLRDMPGDAFAKAGLEGALWDAYAQSAGLPLCELLGARARAIPSGVA